jgi:hypothetical protein
MRDCGINSSQCSLAAFNRVFNLGKKNHFTILGEKDKNKFPPSKEDWRPTTGAKKSNAGDEEVPENVDESNINEQKKDPFFESDSDED